MKKPIETLELKNIITEKITIKVIAKLSWQKKEVMNFRKVNRNYPIWGPGKKKQLTESQRFMWKDDRKRNGSKKSDEIITKHLSGLMKKLTQSGSLIYSKRSTHRHIIVKLMKTKTERKCWKQQKMIYHVFGILNEINSWLLIRKQED